MRSLEDAHMVVTGGAGFIGSSLAELLVARGCSVTIVDSITNYYSAFDKLTNLGNLLGSPRVEFVQADLVTADLPRLFDGAFAVFHLAAQAGVRGSWAGGFDSYVHNNIVATQRVLEACRQVAVGRIVYASSSSVYGRAETYPTTEASPTNPHSPYGVTKLAAEHLMTSYAGNFDLPTVSLRYHTVYGPRQRPDMAIYRLIRAALDGTQFDLFGARQFVRDFTYVGDIAEATVLAAEAEVASGTVLNLAGGESTTMGALVQTIERVVGRDIFIQDRSSQAGDVPRTGADWSAANKLLGWQPRTSLEDGIRAQVGHMKDHTSPVNTPLRKPVL